MNRFDALPENLRRAVLRRRARSFEPAINDGREALAEGHMDLFVPARDEHQAWSVLWQRIASGATVH